MLASPWFLAEGLPHHVMTFHPEGPVAHEALNAPSHEEILAASKVEHRAPTRWGSLLKLPNSSILISRFNRVSGM